MIAIDTNTRTKRERTRNEMMAREGGNRALVDFHVTPPLGRSMSFEGKKGGGASTRLRRTADLLAGGHDGDG